MLAEGVLMLLAAFTEIDYFLYGAIVLFVISGGIKIALWRSGKEE